MSKHFKVVQVLDDYKVAINAGSLSGIKEGQRFLIYSLSSEEIFDPDTNESLGYLEIVRGTGTVTHVQEKLCTIESDKFQSSTRKTVRKSIPYGSLFSDTIEETDREQYPFDNPQVGDLVKRIN